VASYVNLEVTEFSNLDDIFEGDLGEMTVEMPTPAVPEIEPNFSARMNKPKKVTKQTGKSQEEEMDEAFEEQDVKSKLYLNHSINFYRGICSLNKITLQFQALKFYNTKRYFSI